MLKENHYYKIKCKEMERVLIIKHICSCYDGSNMCYIIKDNIFEILMNKTVNLYYEIDECTELTKLEVFNYL